jgi:hypothetical protein
MFMDILFIAALFILALVIIVSRVRKLFDPDCGECSGGCGCCSANSMSENHIIINEGIGEVKCDEKP